MQIDRELFLKKAQGIKLILTDVDGILNNGFLYYTETGETLKAFHVRDGLAIKELLPRHDITVGIITGRSSKALTKRMQDLGVTCVYQAVKNKLAVYKNILEQQGLQNHQVAYLGDDLPDLSIMALVGLSITVPDAPFYIREKAQWCTCTKGGYGAFREVADMILEAQNKSIFDFFE